MKAKPGQRGRQEAESWPCLLGSQYCNRVKNHIVAKPETVGEAQIVGKSHTAVLYILNTKCLINWSAMPEPNLFKLSSAVQGNNSFVLIYVFPEELTQHCYYLVGAGSLKPCCHYTWISFQHLSKISSKIMPDQGIPPQHTLIFCSKPPTPLHSTFLISSGYSSTLLKEPNCIQLSEKIFRILATSEEQDYMSSYICQNSRKTSSFKLLI